MNVCADEKTVARECLRELVIIRQPIVVFYALRKTWWRNTDVKSRLAFTRPRCLAADLEFASVDFATVEVEFELNRSDVGSK